MVGLATVVLVLTTIAVERGAVLVRIDDAVSGRMKDWSLRDSWAKPVIYVLTLPGQRGTVLVLSGLVVGYLWWRTRSVESLLRWLVALAAVAVVVYAFKAAVPRVAPSAVAGESAPNDSYPSGHVVNAIVIWGTLAWCAARAPAARWLPVALRLLAVLAPLAVIVGMTLLDYHWSTDFLAGLCIGVILLSFTTAAWWGALATRVDRRWLRRRGTTDYPLVTNSRS
jgi:PAP2 superfamily